MKNTLNLKICSTVSIAATPLLLCLIQSAALAQTPQDTVRWDDRTNQWVYTLYNPSGSGLYKELRYTPRTLIKPQVANSLHWDAKAKAFEYSYRIHNQADAKQAIEHITLRMPKWDAKAIEEKPYPKGMTSQEEMDQVFAHRALERAFTAKTVLPPAKWDSVLNLKRPERVVAIWTSRYIEAEPKFKGIDPGQTTRGFVIIRPELPAVSHMSMKGDTDDSANAGALPDEGPLAEQVSEMLLNNSRQVPVIVPGILVPVPYNGAELARRIKAHVATWFDIDVAQKPVVDKLTTLLEELAVALESNNINRIHTAAIALFQVTFEHSSAMNHRHFEDDDNEKASRPIDPPTVHFSQKNGNAITQASETPAIHRVAARALGVDLTYLLTRAYMGK